MAAVTDLEVNQRPAKEGRPLQPPPNEPRIAPLPRTAVPGAVRAPLAPPVYLRDAHRTDFPWKIVWNADACIRCGACVSTCTFGALEPKLQRRRQSVAEGTPPLPAESSGVILAIRQVNDPAHYCRGCGMCEKVCPAAAIQPVPNPRNRFAVTARRGGSPIKRGGRAHLIPGRVLDSIKVGRISQMTDPSLDAARHTFDLLTALGRSLPAGKLPLTVVDGALAPAGRFGCAPARAGCRPGC
jgi:glutamate synthase (NADPH/NADH) large chain